MSEGTITDLNDLPELLAEEWVGPLRYFRGQTKDWPLIPSLGRLVKGMSFREVEGMLFHEFKEEFVLRHPDPRKELTFAGAEQFDWDWVFAAIAQHHGLPTRLLDWSTDAGKALFFATAGDELSDGVLYAFHDKTKISLRSGVPYRTFEDSPFRITEVRPFDAVRHGLTFPRIIAQDGVLTFQPDPTNDLIAHLELGRDARQKWAKWRIPRAAKLHLRRQLEATGISMATMFPEAEGVCRHVLYKVLGQPSR